MQLKALDILLFKVIVGMETYLVASNGELLIESINVVFEKEVISHSNNT